MSPESNIESHLKAIRRIMMYFFAFVIIYLMWLLKKLLIPLVLALFFALLLMPLMQWLIKKGVPKVLSIITSALLLFAAVFMIIFLISSSGTALVKDYATIETGINSHLDRIISSISGVLNMDIEKAQIIERMVGEDALGMLFKSTTGFALRMTNFTADFTIMMIYLFAILAGMTNIEKYFDYLEYGTASNNDGSRSQVLLGAFNEIHHSLFTYMKIKFIASFATGIGYGLVAYFFGLKFSILIGFIAMALNFIPTIGSIIATVPPALLGLFYIQSGISYSVMLVLLISIQFTVGNIIEPRFQGQNLGINFLTVILGLVFFGFLWGVVGMLLSVPMLVLARVILSQVPGTQWLVRLMGQYHELPDTTPEQKPSNA